MKFIFSGKGATVTIILLIIVAGIFLIVKGISKPVVVPVVETVTNPKPTVIGRSVAGREITAYTYAPVEGAGNNHIIFVGGIHGGYEWNSVLLAYKFMDYLKANPNIIPKNMMVSVIPSVNPDGVFKVAGKEGRFTQFEVNNNLPNGTGRFNNNSVDLNRNFDCNWQATSTWKNNKVSAGTKPFSEPEAVALRDFIFKDKPQAVIFWHSQSNAVYASKCNDGILPGTLNLMNTYATAANYPAVKTFTSYAVTGAVEDWLASINIPAITVELSTHETVEWEKNLSGILATLKYFGNK